MLLRELTTTPGRLRLLATVIEDSNDAIVVQDLHGRLRVWNRGAQRMYGWSEAEALGMRAEDLVPIEDREAARRLIEAVRRGEDPPSQEVRRRTKDGRVLDVWLTATLLTDDQGRPVAVATTERDITERKRAEAELRRFATVLRDSNDAVTMQDLDGTILAWNRGAERMYGWSEAEAVGMNIERLVPEADRAQARGLLEAIRRGEEVPSLEVRRVARDGRLLDVWVTTTRLVDDRGRPAAVATTERDITERKRAEAELRRFATVLRDSNDAVTMQDLDGTILAWNRGAERMYGWSEAEAVGMSVERLVPEADRAQARGLLEAIRRGEEVPSLEVRRVARDGRLLDVWITTTRLVDDRGRPVAVATTERDITERKRMAEEMKRLVEQLNDALQARDEFLAIASHELRGPVSALTLKLELLQRQARGGGPAERLASGLDSAGKTVGRLGRLIDELLDVSRITAGRLRLEVEEVDLSALVGDVVERLSEVIARSGAPLSLRVQPGVRLRCDKLRIEQVLVNLVTNAAKYGGGAPIEVELVADASQVTLVVRDQGPGIPEAEQERIFERFARAAPRGVGGLGLGLYISRQIVEAHGGLIRLESRPGAGAAFSVILPRSA